MGRHTSAATTNRYDSARITRRNHFPMNLLLILFFVFSTAAHSKPASVLGVQKSSPPVADESVSAPLSDRAPRASVAASLDAGDTLEAIEILHDNAGQEWADSLLDLMILPGDDASPKDPSTSPRASRAKLVTRLAFRRIPSSVSHGIWSSTGQAAWIFHIPFAGIENTIVPAVSIHDVEAAGDSYRALESRISWAGRRGIHRASTGIWTLVGTSNDAGIDASWRIFPLSWGWAEAEASLSLESEQEAALGTGFEGTGKSWIWTGSFHAGWVRALDPAPYRARILDIDSVELYPQSDGTIAVAGAERDGHPLFRDVLADSIASSGEEIETIDFDRLFVRAHFLVLREASSFQIGPGFGLEGRLSTGTERWMPDLRETWTSGSLFLLERRSGKVRAISDSGTSPVALPARSLIKAVYFCARLTPSLHGSWRTRDRTWQVDALVAWNQVFASAPGHPLEDDTQGFEARLALQKRW